MVYEKVIELVADQFGVDADTLNRDTSFEETLGADSLDIVELTMSIETEFEIGDIDEDVLEGLRTIGDVVDLISSKIAD